MSEAVLPESPRSQSVIGTLQRIAKEKIPSLLLRRRFAAIQELLGEELRDFEQRISELPQERVLAQEAAHHLLGLEGKRLRPICVLLAAKIGIAANGTSSVAGRACASAMGDAVQLGVAAELVHTATLLHDDVVDEGTTRRGRDTARIAYGNAASIFAGDWLLLEALRRVRHHAPLATLDHLFEVIDQMIVAESMQLERRGHLEATTADWYTIVEGKTAALFRWALRSGALAGGLSEPQCASLERFGYHMGVAFQAIDDVLDLVGEAEQLGKDPLADLREGKLTWPLLAGLERDPDLSVTLRRIANGPSPCPPEEARALVRRLHALGTVEDCRGMAKSHASSAVAHLDSLPPSPARESLAAAAWLAVERGR